MKAKVITGYQRGKLKDQKEYPNEYPFVLITIIAGEQKEDQNRVATYVELGKLEDRESRLFIERSPPEINWLREVFRLLENTGQRGITSGGLHEIRVDAKDIEIHENEKAIIDNEENIVYSEDEDSGSKQPLDKWRTD